MNRSGDAALRSRYEATRIALSNLKSGKHNGAERAYGIAYDNLAKNGAEMRLKAKYRGG